LTGIERVDIVGATMSQSDFQEHLRGNTGCAVIVAGSDSDKGHIQKLTSALKMYEIPYEVRICSAHKSPGRLLDLIAEYEGRGGLVWVAVAGGTDALSGTLAFHADHPVISCPPDGLNHSCLTNPPGSSNATILSPKNAARFIAQVYSAVNPRLKELLAGSRVEKICHLEAKDAEFRNRQ
jgi:5-(carboxyamino)imidazole ribonucleotide mutase